MNKHYVVVVQFQLHAEHQAAFEQAMRANAEASRRTEPGCLQFDVCRAEDGSILLYEVYTDRAAFDAHLATAHFQAFAKQVAPWVASKTVHTWVRIAAP